MNIPPRITPEEYQVALSHVEQGETSVEDAIIIREYVTQLEGKLKEYQTAVFEDE